MVVVLPPLSWTATLPTLYYFHIHRQFLMPKGHLKSRSALASIMFTSSMLSLVKPTCIGVVLSYPMLPSRLESALFITVIVALFCMTWASLQLVVVVIGPVLPLVAGVITCIITQPIAFGMARSAVDPFVMFVLAQISPLLTPTTSLSCLSPLARSKFSIVPRPLSAILNALLVFIAIFCLVPMLFSMVVAVYGSAQVALNPWLVLVPEQNWLLVFSRSSVVVPLRVD